MRKISRLALLILFMLSACANADNPPTSTLSPIPTATKTPSLTPTEIPATPTKALPKEGDTRIKEGVGEQVYTVIRGKNGEVMYADWVRVKAEGIPLQDYTTDQYLGADLWGIIKVVCSDRFDGSGLVPKFTHVDKVVENPKGDVSTRGATIIRDRLKIATAIDLYNYQLSHPNGIDFSFFLTDPEHPITWTMRPEPHSSVVEILTDWNDPILDGGQDIRISTSLTLRSKILGVDQAGRLIGVVALSELPPEGAEYNDWRADVWSAAIFLHSAMVLQQEDVLNIQDHSVLGDLMNKSHILNEQGNPWIIIESDK